MRYTITEGSTRMDLPDSRRSTVKEYLDQLSSSIPRVDREMGIALMLVAATIRAALERGTILATDNAVAALKKINEVGLLGILSHT